MSAPASAATRVDRKAALAWFRKNRRRTDDLFSLLAPQAYFDRPIDLRNPICFYEGHLPAFNVNTLIRRGLKEPGVDAELETLFERGIDPERPVEEGSAARGWPPRDTVRQYAARADALVSRAIESGDIDREDVPVLRGGLALFTILEHEPMHHETLLYMWHRLPYERKRRPEDLPRPVRGGEPPAEEMVRIPAGRATLGAGAGVPFSWDNERPAHRVDVPAFQIDLHDVTNQAWLEFIEAGGYRREDLWTPEGWHWVRAGNVEHPLFWEREGGSWVWRGMFDRVHLPPAWPVYVTQAEASAFARWKGKRLPTEPEFHRAAFGAPEGSERSHPWGEEPPDPSRGNFDFQRFDPVPVGSFPAGRSAWGVHDLVGNGWEWTSTVFGPFPGFEPLPTYPAYSADFFDGKHFVMKGASPATPAELLRGSFRNWFRGTYPYMYAAFRCAQ